MVFTAKSPKINIEEVRSLSKLEGQALANKQQRDQELEAIIRGEDQRILLVIGPCSSDNEEAVLEYAKRLSKLQDEVITSSCNFDKRLAYSRTASSLSDEHGPITNKMR